MAHLEGNAGAIARLAQAAEEEGLPGIASSLRQVIERVGELPDITLRRAQELSPSQITQVPLPDASISRVNLSPAQIASIEAFLRENARRLVTHNDVRSAAMRVTIDTLPLGMLKTTYLQALRTGNLEVAEILRRMVLQFGDFEPEVLHLEAEPIYEHPYFTFDPNLSEIRRESKHIQLSPQEEQLMRLLTANPNVMVGLETIVQEVLGGDKGRDIDQVSNHIHQLVSHLRRKIGSLSETVSGAPKPDEIIRKIDARGYAFVDGQVLARRMRQTA